MKIVKEHINEIKRENKGTGLGSINVGNTAVTKAYDILKNNYPDIIASVELKYAYDLISKYFNDKNNTVAFIHETDMTQELIHDFNSLLYSCNNIKDESYFEKPQRTVYAEVSTCIHNGITALKKTIVPSDKTRDTKIIYIYLIKVPKNHEYVWN
jgi:phage terminase large subunit